MEAIDIYYYTHVKCIWIAGTRNLKTCREGGVQTWKWNGQQCRIIRRCSLDSWSWGASEHSEGETAQHRGWTKGIRASEPHLMLQSETVLANGQAAALWAGFVGETITANLPAESSDRGRSPLRAAASGLIRRTRGEEYFWNWHSSWCCWKCNAAHCAKEAEPCCAAGFSC